MTTNSGLKVVNVERINPSQMYVTLEVRKGVHARTLYRSDGTPYCGREDLELK